MRKRRGSRASVQVVENGRTFPGIFGDWFFRLPLILAAALLLRLGFLLHYVAHRPHQALGAIPFLFEPGNIAFSIAGGHGFASPFRVETGPTAWMTPVWPYLLAGIFRIFGTYTFRAF